MNASTALSQCQVKANKNQRKAVRAEKEQLWGSMGAPLLLRGWGPPSWAGHRTTSTASPQAGLQNQRERERENFPAEEPGVQNGTSHPEKWEVGFRGKETSSSISQVSINPGWSTFHFFADQKSLTSQGHS